MVSESNGAGAEGDVNSSPESLGPELSESYDGGGEEEKEEEVK